MAWKFTKEDLRRLNQAHPDLVKVFMEVQKTSTIPIKILQVSRSIEEQRANVRRGVSWTMRSRHLPSKDGKCRAVDAVPLNPDGTVSWAWPIYYKLAPQVKAAARAAKVKVEWGGDWKKNKDGPHWQLPWKEYP